MLRNIGSTWVVTLVTIAATYVLTPFLIRSLGAEGYGTWTLITALTGYMSLMALGVPMACVRYLAGHVAEGDTRKANQVIGSCAGLYLMVGAAALVLGAALAALFHLYALPVGLQAQAGLAYGLMVVYVSAGFIGLLPEGILFAHLEFVGRNAVRIAGVVLRLILTVGLLTLRPTLVVLALVQLACLAFDFAASWLLIHRRYPQCASVSPTSTVRRSGGSSPSACTSCVLQAGVRLTWETDALVIGALLGVGAVPYYAVANSLIVYLMEFIIAIAAVVSPMATRLHTEGKHEELRAIFLKWSKVALSLSLLAGLFLIVLGPAFIAPVDRSLVRGARGPGAADPDGLLPAVPARPGRRPADPHGDRQAEEPDGHVPPGRTSQRRAERGPGPAVGPGRRRAGHGHSQRAVRGGPARDGVP